MQSVIDCDAWSARDLCVIGKNTDFVTFLSNYVLYFAKKNVDTWELGDIISRYKRVNSLVKIIKEKFGNLKTCRYREMSI